MYRDSHMRSMLFLITCLWLST